MQCLKVLCCGCTLVMAVPADAGDVPPFAAFRATGVPADYPSPADYLRVLSRWPRYAETDWREVEGDASMAYYGPGDSGWGMMCHASAMFCYALLAADPEYVPWESGPDRETLLRRVNQGLKFMARCHISGDMTCTDDKHWSDAQTKWHSATWAENMGAAADLVWDKLTPENQEAVRRVLTFEAERLSEETIPSGAFSDTKAESNAWNASVIARAVVMFSDDPRAPKWREKAIEWAMNTLSAPQDAEDETIIDGRAVKDWVSTVNVHASFASENHGYYHVCYMWWPMWCLASAHYSFASHGQPTPQSMFHHWRDLFSVLKRCYLADGRFAYVGGKDWPRYVYGLTAAMPAYAVLADELGESAARAMEREAFRRYEWEQLYNGDGSFLGQRLADLKSSGPNGFRSYCRYEADEAIMLGLAYRLHKLKAAPPAPRGDRLQEMLRGGFECPDAQIVFRRDDERFVGWSWKTRTRRPQGIIAVPGDPALCEWDYNLCGSFEIDGVRGEPMVSTRNQGLMEGGLWAAGTLQWGRESPPREQVPRWLEVVDDNVRVKAITRPDHPIFNQPHGITDVTSLIDLDSIKTASPDWAVLAQNERGGPSIIEAEVGRGRILVCMNGADSDYNDGKPGGKLFENIMAYVKSHSEGPIGYLAQQNSTRAALEQYGIEFEPITQLTATDLSQFGAIVMDRGSNPDVRAEAWRLVRFAEQGGLLVRFCLQDTEWDEDQLSGLQPKGAVTHHVGCIALPDGRTTAVCELAVANRRLSIRALSGLNWNVGNDVFNGNQRTLFTDAGRTLVEGLGGEAMERELPGNWLNIDDRMGLAVAGSAQLLLLDRTTRTAPHRSYCYETVALREPGTQEAAELREYGPDSVVLDHVTAFYSGIGHERTRRLAGALRRLVTSPARTSAALVRSPSGPEFVVMWNLNEEPCSVSLVGVGTIPDSEAEMPGMTGTAYEVARTADEDARLRLVE